MRSIVLIVVGSATLSVAVSSCKKSETTATGTAPNSSPAATVKVGPPKFDACTLLTREEVGQVQGSPIKDAIRSGQTNGRIQAAQCYYSAETSHLSVSLAVTLNDPDSKDMNATREYWDQTFGRVEKEGNETEADKEKRESMEKQRGRGEEEEEHGPPPKKIEGVGEKAFWSGNAVGGALYALKNNAIVRVSVGGQKDEAARIDKSKVLAQKALDRLP